VLAEIEGAGLGPDVVKALAVGLPKRPAAAAGVVEQLPAGLLVLVIEPDLAGLGAAIAFAPPGRAFPGEEHPPPIRRYGAVFGVVVEERLFGAAAAQVDAEQ